MNKEVRIIEGHCKLELIHNNIYLIEYGVNQGLYRYIGQEDNKSDFWYEASIFENIITNKKFCYYGINSPYEFTSIIKDTKEFSKEYYNNIYNHYKKEVEYETI